MATKCPTPAIVFATHREPDLLAWETRVLAAREFFPPRDQWWNVALYDSSQFQWAEHQSTTLTRIALPPSTYVQLVQEYKNDLHFSDGDIFRYYRQAQKADNEQCMRRWEARLSESKLRNLLQIEKAHHGRVIQALDTLLPLQGIWQDFHLGAFNRILPMHTWQVVLP